MSIFWRWLLWILLGLGSSHPVAPSNQPENRSQIVPGVRVGPITRESARADLVRFFGAAAVEDGAVYLGEGETEAGAFVNKEDPSRALAIQWLDPKNQRGPKTITVCYELRKGACLWRTTSGVTHGSSLKDLEEANGRPFRMVGFDFDYSGAVVSWEGGSLETVPEGCGRLRVRLQPPPDWTRGLTPREVKQVMGDREVSSQNAVMRRLNPKVYYLAVEFPAQGTAGCKQ